MSEIVNHPTHYGGVDNPYEAIKVVEAWGLGFCLGNCVKYISRAGKKLLDVKTVDPGDVIVSKVEDLRKAMWYLDREIQSLVGNDHLQRVGHLCACGHTLGGHSSKTHACQLCVCLGFNEVKPL